MLAPMPQSTLSWRLTEDDTRVSNLSFMIETASPKYLATKVDMEVTARVADATTVSQSSASTVSRKTIKHHHLLRGPAEVSIVVADAVSHKIH